MKLATIRFGLPGKLVREALDRLDSSKFEKLDLIELGLAKSWTEMVAIINRESV